MSESDGEHIQDKASEENSSQQAVPEETAPESSQKHSQQDAEVLKTKSNNDSAQESKEDAQVAAETTPESASESDVEPHKRLGEADPEELAYALKQVFNGGEEKPYSAQSKIANSKPRSVLALGLIDSGEAADREDKQIESKPITKSGYDNPFALFADVFYGMLVAPRPTLAILSDCKRFPPTAGNLSLTFALVVGALAMPAMIKAGANGWTTMAWLKAAAFIGGNLFDWCMLAVILYYLGIWLRGHKLTPGNALIATGWAFLPFAFFAPVACFKSALGGGFTLLACLPALWFLLLEWFAFQVSLRTSAVKLALIAFVVPPIFCLVYLFWIGLAVATAIGQLVSHLA